MPVETHGLGYAQIVQRRTPTFPTQWANYFDLTPWGGGYLRCVSMRGAARIKDDVLVDLQSGRVYRDSRFPAGA